MNAQFADMLMGIAVIFYFSNARFNRWPRSSSRVFSGNPRDFISDSRYYTFFLIYFFTYISILYIAHSVPEFANMILKINDPNSDVDGFYKMFGDKSFLFFSFLVIATINNPKLFKIDEYWREKLLIAAKIPKNFHESFRILNSENTEFQPDPNRIQNAIKSLKTNNSSEFWSDVENNIEQHRDNQTNEWRLVELKCLTALIEENKKNNDLNETQRIKNLISEIESDVSNKNSKNKDTKTNILKTKTLLHEKICRNVIKENSEEYDQIEELRELGFKRLPNQQTPNITLEPIIIIFFTLVFASLMTAVVVQQVLPHINLEFSKVARWTTLHSISYALVLFISISICANYANKKGVVTKNIKAITLSTITTFCVLFILANPSPEPEAIAAKDDITKSNEQRTTENNKTLDSSHTLPTGKYSDSNTDQTIADQSKLKLKTRLALAFSFALFCPVIIGALTNIPDHKTHIFIGAIKYSAYFSITSAASQVLILIAFYPAIVEDSPRSALQHSNLAPYFAIIGFTKGLIIAFISYTIIQIHFLNELVRQARQHRREPIARRAKIKLGNQEEHEENEEELNCTVVDLSKGGAKLRVPTNRNIEPTSSALLILNSATEVKEAKKCRVAWCKKDSIFTNTKIAGLEFCD